MMGDCEGDDEWYVRVQNYYPNLKGCNFEEVDELFSGLMKNPSTVSG